MSLNIKMDFNKDKNIWIAVPDGGEIDIYTSPKLKEKLLGALEDKKLVYC